MESKPNILKEKSFEFALEIIGLYKTLSSNKEFIISKQLLRSGTSIGANVREAQNAESKPDFIHKLSVAQKECDEALYSLELLFKSGYITSEQHTQFEDKASQLLRIIKSSILTTKSNLKKV